MTRTVIAESALGVEYALTPLGQPLEPPFIARYNGGAALTYFASPNLPSRDFRATSLFYAKLGFVETWCDDDWMILERGDLLLEFFPHLDLNPAASWFS